MDIRKISDQFFVSPQISPADLIALQQAGIHSVICNRPDAEEAAQPTFDDIAQVARKVGLKTCHIPVSGGVFSDDDLAAFGRALENLPAPILAYCRSGTRSATLWALSKAETHPIADILSATERAGYDVNGVMAHASSVRGSFLG